MIQVGKSALYCGGNDELRERKTSERNKACSSSIFIRDCVCEEEALQLRRNETKKEREKQQRKHAPDACCEKGAVK